MSTDPDASRCPMCGQPNGCALAAARDDTAAAPTCWCVGRRFPRELLARVSEATPGRACICLACLERGAEPEPTPASAADPQPDGDDRQR